MTFIMPSWPKYFYAKKVFIAQFVEYLAMALLILRLAYPYLLIQNVPKKNTKPFVLLTSNSRLLFVRYFKRTLKDSVSTTE